MFWLFWLGVVERGGCLPFRVGILLVWLVRFVELVFTGDTLFIASENCFSAAVGAANFLVARGRAKGVGATWFVEERGRVGADWVIIARDSSKFNDLGVVVPAWGIVHLS